MDCLSASWIGWPARPAQTIKFPASHEENLAWSMLCLSNLLRIVSKMETSLLR
jgi:hypothetical protein